MDSIVACNLYTVEDLLCIVFYNQYFMHKVLVHLFRHPYGGVYFNYISIYLLISLLPWIVFNILPVLTALPYVFLYVFGEYMDMFLFFFWICFLGYRLELELLAHW